MMVGDGANDALALSAAYVGVAVQGSFETSMKSADIYSKTLGIDQIPYLFKIANKTKSIVFINLILSTIYNLVGGTCAILGYVTPLFAAFLMPLSALTVFAFTTISMNEESLK